MSRAHGVLVWSAALALACIGLAPVAAAEADDADLHPSGFEPSIHVGVGGYSRHYRFPGSAEWAPGERNPSVGVHLVLAYRFGPVFDAGLHVAHQWLVVEGLQPGADATATSNAAGALVRLHPLAALWPRLPIDLTLGGGMDVFASARQTTETNDGVATTEARAAVPGVGLPVWLGLDVLLGGTALGVMAMWAPWWRFEECASVGTGLPDCEHRTSEPVHYLFLGAGFRQHLEFVQ